MSKHQSKQAVSELMPKSRLSSASVTQKLNVKATTNDPEAQTLKRKTLSKLSMIGSNGNRGVLFHRRGDRLKIPKYQNTFRLDPFRAFHATTVDKIIRDVMETKLTSVKSYHPDQMSKLCLEISADVQKAVGKKDYDRYKVVVQVNIIQRFHQSIHAAFQCLWDVERDNCSYHVFESSCIHAWCCVYGIYYE